jgi:hypothetical protein
MDFPSLSDTQWLAELRVAPAHLNTWSRDVMDFDINSLPISVMLDDDAEVGEDCGSEALRGLRNNETGVSVQWEDQLDDKGVEPILKFLFPKTKIPKKCFPFVFILNMEDDEDSDGEESSAEDSDA